MPARDDDERRISPFPIPLSLAHVTDAITRSHDGGLTILLSKLSLSDIGATEAEELAHAGQHGHQETNSVVERLALGNNRLTTLPTEFALFSHLRYLNLKHNLFATFPEVLTLMSSLDTLDISHNKIKRLPSHPGNLVRLKVFCLSRNKVTRLPAYLTQFRQLDVLQVERNPIEWPPQAVLESFGNIQDANNTKDWIRKLQSWMEAEGSKGREYDDSGYSEHPDWGNEPSYDSWRFPLHETAIDACLAPHGRSFSVDSNTSLTSILESSHEYDQSKQKYTPSRRPLNVLGLNSNGRQLLRPSATDTTSSTTPQSQFEGLPGTDQMHLRTSSHTNAFRKPQFSSIAGKKSLPDLRTIPKDPMKRIPTLPERKSPLPVSSVGKTLEESSAQPPTSLRQDSGSSSGSIPPPYTEDLQASNARVLPLVAVERNSYFRRLSTMPINNSLPQPLQVLLESARSILFVVGQLYQILEQYVHHGVSEHLSANFKKVLDPANVNMLHLIRSLDRFDDVSQKSMPSPAVCRGLVESCRDTVTVFRKAVGLLTLHIGLEPSDDARYTRWLILELYATTAELAMAWQNVVPYVETLKSFVYGSTFSQTPSFSVGGTPDVSGFYSSLPRLEQLAPSVRLRPAETLHAAFGLPVAGRTRTTRRHAGSFSSKDVQIGKELPSCDILPSMAGGVATHTPTLRTPKRQATVPLVTTSTPNTSLYPFNPSSYFGPHSDTPYHLRHASHNSLLDSSLMSPSASQESPAINKSHTDKDVLQAVQGAIDIAPTVWDQIEEALSDFAFVNRDVEENLEQARSVTKSLSDDIAAMSEGYSEAHKRHLREDAHHFLKTLVQLSNILKTHGNSRSVSAALRSNMVKLTNSTEEFAILLQVSSISSYIPRSSSPTSTLKYAPYNTASYSVEDNQLASSLSRSRIAQPTLSSSKLSFSSAYESPRGIMPPATRIPSVRRLQLPRDASSDTADPG